VVDLLGDVKFVWSVVSQYTATSTVFFLAQI